uniref:Squamosa promoter-binding-like protein 12 n=1 Tax=Tanacetum cinerariifolium TaxID=118510 RepID=A0A6L2NPM8_TANCI|nr:squamosa promoter-binding-like protein 12 [Tanacetum cinerariifolium]
MDWNLNTPTEWEWENLAMYNNKEIEVPKNLQFSSHESQENVVVDNVDFAFSASTDSSSKGAIKNFEVFDDLPKEFLEKEESSWVEENGSFSNMVEDTSVLSGEAMIGLKLGRHASTSSCNIKTATTSAPLFSTASPMIKRSRASYLSSQSPRCQVEGCNLDLASAKDYHRRHRICANHSKSPKVVVAGMEQFDDRKRSCRRRLSAHNARRRRPQSEEIQFSSTRISSSISDRRPQMDFLLSRASVPILDSAPPESSCSFKEEESLLGLTKGGGVDVCSRNGTLNFGSERFMPRNVNHNGMDATSNSIISTDVRNAFSLLSTSSWPSNWHEEPSSFDQFANGNNNISLAQPGIKSHGQDDHMRLTCEGIEDPKDLLMGIQDYLLDAEKGRRKSIRRKLLRHWVSSGHGGVLAIVSWRSYCISILISNALERLMASPSKTHKSRISLEGSLVGEWNKANLHDPFLEVGEISDVYVARKLTKAGKSEGSFCNLTHSARGYFINIDELQVVFESGGGFRVRRMPFGLCNAPATFQRDANRVLNWEKCHFMVKEGIVFRHKVSGAGLEVNKAKINTIVHIDHLALRHLFKKQDVKLRLIHWILFLREFDIEIKDKKGTKNVAADHLSRIENDETSDDNEVDDNFPRETLIEISTKDEPWFTDFANYLEPYLFKVCSDGMIRRCVSEPETRTILDQCHHGPTGGHYRPNTTAKKSKTQAFTGQQSSKKLIL